MGKYVSIGQLRQQTGRAFASLKTYMDKSVRDPIMSVAMQAKALADSVVQRANAGEFNGARGPQGVPGPRGADGAQGQEGRQGEQGEPGPAGRDGRTPVRGTDYWTAEDRAQTVSDVLQALPVWEGGSY